MASVYYGLDRGASANPDLVTVGASTGSKDVELRVDTGVSLKRNDVEILVRTLVERMLQPDNKLAG